MHIEFIDAIDFSQQIRAPPKRPSITFSVRPRSQPPQRPTVILFSLFESLSRMDPLLDEARVVPVTGEAEEATVAAAAPSFAVEQWQDLFLEMPVFFQVPFTLHLPSPQHHISFFLCLW